MYAHECMVDVMMGVGCDDVMVGGAVLEVVEGRCDGVKCGYRAERTVDIQCCARKRGYHGNHNYSKIHYRGLIFWKEKKNYQN